MEPASPELEPAQQRRQSLSVSDIGGSQTTASNRPMLSTSTWRLRPLTRLSPSKPRAQWVRPPSGTDCVSTMATLGDWGRLRCSRTQGAQVAVNALPRREVRRQHAPGAAGPQHIQNGLDHSPQVGLAGPSQLGISREIGRECRPLCLAQPRGVAGVVASMACPPCSSVRQPTPWKLSDF